MKPQRGRRVAAIELAKRATGTSAAWLGIAALVLVAAAPGADAGQKQQKQKKAPAAEAVLDIDNGEPMMLVVSVGHQKVDIYRGTKLVTTSAVSTGTAAHPTMIGAFSILEKQRWHHSNIYSGAPMPWMNRITWSGTALHAGVVPGYPASHGCIRLLYSFAPKLFQMTTVGDNVIVSRGRPVPTIIEHTALFQPLPPQSLALKAETPRITAVQPISSPLSAIAAAASPVILAKAETPTTVDSEAHSPAEPAAMPDLHAFPDASSDPNRTHAVTPDLGDDTRALGAPSAVDVTEQQVASTLPPSPDVAAPVDAAAAAPAALPPVAKSMASGAAAAALRAAEPRSEAPLRMLLTRRTQRDRIIGLQQVFAGMGQLPQQNFDGTMGKATIAAIKTFQKANGLPPTGAISDELVKKVYEVAGKGEPPAGHLFVRQQFATLFDLPVSFRNADEPLGTHIYTALKFAPGDTKAPWMTLDVQDNHDVGPLDRIEIPADIRQRISERLTPGSTLIIADTSINSANLPKGGDFVVLAKSTNAKVSDAGEEVAKPKPRRRNRTATRRYYDNYQYNYPSRSAYPWRSNTPWYARPW